MLKLNTFPFQATNYPRVLQALQNVTSYHSFTLSKLHTFSTLSFVMEFSVATEKGLFSHEGDQALHFLLTCLVIQYKYVDVVQNILK